MREMNGSAKREEVVNVFKRGKPETKLEGNGDISWCGVNSTIAGVPEID